MVEAWYMMVQSWYVMVRNGTSLVHGGKIMVRHDIINTGTCLYEHSRPWYNQRKNMVKRDKPLRAPLTELLASGIRSDIVL